MQALARDLVRRAFSLYPDLCAVVHTSQFDGRPRPQNYARRNSIARYGKYLDPYGAHPFFTIWMLDSKLRPTGRWRDSERLNAQDHAPTAPKKHRKTRDPSRLPTRPRQISGGGLINIPAAGARNPTSKLPTNPPGPPPHISPAYRAWKLWGRTLTIWTRGVTRAIPGHTSGISVTASRMAAPTPPRLMSNLRFCAIEVALARKTTPPVNFLMRCAPKAAAKFRADRLDALGILVIGTHPVDQQRSSRIPQEIRLADGLIILGAIRRLVTSAKLMGSSRIRQFIFGFPLAGALSRRYTCLPGAQLPPDNPSRR